MKLKIITNKPVAIDSYDHIKPHGTMQDNTANDSFVEAVIKKFTTVKYADLGCAGGWFPHAFHRRGHIGVGVEGSDYSLINKRAEWGVVPDILFTADITDPFQFVTEDTNERFRFNVMSAFDVLEHIPEEKLPGLFNNLKLNLEPNGYFICSIANFGDMDGNKYHVTLKPQEWWLEKFNEYGFVREEFLQQGEYGRSSSYDLTFINTNAS